MHAILFLIAFCALINGDCIFRSNDSQALQNKIKQWKIYNTIFTASTQTSTYQIGICITPNNSNIDAAIIQKENQELHVLGQINQNKLVGGDNWILLTYENGSHYNNQCNNKSRSSLIMFVCGQNTNRISVIQEHTSKDAQCNYLFQIQIPEICSKENKSTNGGTIFLIIICCFISAYLIGGFLFMRLIRGARGIDQIPNLDMWRKLGHLTADGCDFCCRYKSNAPRPGYFTDETEPDMRADDDILSP